MDIRAALRDQPTSHVAQRLVERKQEDVEGERPGLIHVFARSDVACLHAHVSCTRNKEFVHSLTKSRTHPHPPPHAQGSSLDRTLAIHNRHTSKKVTAHQARLLAQARSCVVPNDSAIDSLIFLATLHTCCACWRPSSVFPLTMTMAMTSGSARLGASGRRPATSHQLRF